MVLLSGAVSVWQILAARKMGAMATAPGPVEASSTVGYGAEEGDRPVSARGSHEASEQSPPHGRFQSLALP